jgi:hypothetical protein
MDYIVEPVIGRISATGWLVMMVDTVSRLRGALPRDLLRRGPFLVADGAANSGCLLHRGLVCKDVLDIPPLCFYLMWIYTRPAKEVAIGLVDAVRSSRKMNIAGVIGV